MELVKGIVEYDKGRFADPYGNGVQRFDRLTTYVDMAIRGLGDNTASAIEVAKALFYIRKDELYKDYPIPGSDGVSVFQDFNTFCKEIFKCRKSTVYNYIALYETFGGDSVEASATPSNFNVSDYTYTQLLLMLPLSAPERLNIKPDWTCRQIKDYVKERKGKISNRLESKPETVDEPMEDDLEVFKLNNDEARKAFLKTFTRWSRSVTTLILDEIIDVYEVVLTDTAKLYATLYHTFRGHYCRYLLVDKTFSPYGWNYEGVPRYSSYICTDEKYIVDFLRDKKIKSVKILSKSRQEPR